MLRPRFRLAKTAVYSVLLHLRTFFKNFVCAQFSFARRNVYHLRTILMLHFARIFLHPPLPWPAVGILLYKGTTNKISTLAPLFTDLVVEELSHLKSILVLD